MAATDTARLRRDRPLRLRAGERVRVRPAAEILRTLDAQGAVDGLPFMPEMLAYCGRELRVFKSAHKTCDTIEKSGIRRMRDAVHLDGVRCDGAAHGGCQAGCLLFWKEAWLERIDGRPPERGTPTAEPVPGAAADALRRGTRRQDGGEAEPRFRCQATELLRATSPLRAWDPRPYLRDVWSGNVSLRELLRVLAVAAFNRLQALRGGGGYPRFQPRLDGPTPSEHLGLRPGEVVEVRSKAEIERTLSRQSKNRGLWFDLEMVPYCGGRFRVARVVERIIDEKTGRMLHFRNDCVVLDGVTCRAWFSRKRLFCPRSITPYWREIWLRRAEESPTA